jgi:ABC-type Co2+ transport system permease subunit
MSLPIDPQSDDPATDEFPVGLRAEPTDESTPKPLGGGLVPGVSGVVLCVLLIMAVGLVVAQIASRDGGRPGPGPITIGVHIAGLAAGFVCYRFSRGRGPRRVLGLLAILVVAGLLLWFYWWSPS